MSKIYILMTTPSSRGRAFAPRAMKPRSKLDRTAPKHGALARVLEAGEGAGKDGKTLAREV
jgi:hypothetical protein